MNLNKKYLIFAVVLILLVISIVYRILNPFVQPKTDRLTYTGKQTKEKRDTGKASITKNDLTGSHALVAKFLNKPEAVEKTHKDLFAIYRPPRKKRMPLPVKKETVKPEKVEPVKTDPVQEVKDYLFSYTFYGSYKSEDQTAVFLGKNKLVLVAKRGDRLDGKYLIDEIRDNYIRIKALDLNETIHLDTREFNDE